MVDHVEPAVDVKGLANAWCGNTTAVTGAMAGKRASTGRERHTKLLYSSLLLVCVVHKFGLGTWKYDGEEHNSPSR